MPSASVSCCPCANARGAAMSASKQPTPCAAGSPSASRPTRPRSRPGGAAAESSTRPTSPSRSGATTRRGHLRCHVPPDIAASRYLGLGYEAIPRAWRPAARPTQLGTRSERKFGAGGPRRTSTWQWLLRWGGIIMNGWPASRGGCCKGSAWEQMQYCVRTFC